MDKLNVVFIMGAGFSAEAGCPVMSNFLDKSRKIFRRSERNEFIERSLPDFYNVEKSIGELNSMQAKAYLDLENIETLFGALEFGSMINKFGSKSKEEIDALRDSLIKVIVTTIEYSSKYQIILPSYKIYPLPAYIKFFEYLSNYQSACDFSFITFNYDLIIDVGLESHSMRYNYSLDQSNFSEIPLLKLHGSLNWYSEWERIRVQALPDKKYIDLLLAERIKKEEDDGLVINRIPNEKIYYDYLPIGSEIIKSYKVPLIVPPTLNKFKYQEQLKNIWAKAASVLSEAELVFIIGYSMPETDVFFKYLYSLGIDSPNYFNKLIVINNDGNLQQKFANLSNNQHSFKKFRFITGSFSQYIESIFNEITQLT
jgi:hypothetical protein